MKPQRHAAILHLVREHRVPNQARLQELLAKAGFDVTQATLSRDIHELGNEYIVVVTKKGDIDDITLKVEVLPQYKKDTEAIKARLADQLRLKTNLGYNIEFHEYESLPRSQAKSRRFQDMRPHL